MRHPLRPLRFTGRMLRTGVMLAGLSVLLLCSQAQELQSDPGIQAPAASAVTKPAPPSTNNSVVLHGGVTTLESAIATETSIDWYAWYLAARQYLKATGGISCPVGTPIRFYKNGRLDAGSRDPACLYSLQNKNFPLPDNTRLEAVILPTRSAVAPPANPTELYDHVLKSRH